MRTGTIALLIAAAALAGLAAGCGADESTAERRQALEDYVAEVEPIRLGINELLDKGDPIMGAYADGRFDAAEAKRRMGRLEAKEADYAVQIAEVDPPDDVRAAHD